MTHADILITNARVITMDKAKPFAEAVAVKGNTILRVGSTAELAAFRGPKTRAVDARKNSVIPGIIESHVHLFIGAAELDLLDIRACLDFDSIARVVADYRHRNPNLPVIHVIGATHGQFGQGVVITRHPARLSSVRMTLDAASPLTRSDSSATVVSILRLGIKWVDIATCERHSS